MDYHYTYRVEWSTNYDQYVGRCVEVHGLFESAPTAQQALAKIETAVSQHLREMDEVFRGEPPKPLTEQNYSGRFMVRTSREMHANLTIEAAEQRVSLNQWVVQKLARPRPAADW
jgi:predicted HicB family RNase H-like nuclease